MTTVDETLNPQAALAWHLAMGADEALGETPTDWAVFAPPKGTAATLNNSAAKPSTPSAPAANTALHQNIPQNAPQNIPVADATSLHALREALQNFNGCSLRKTALNLVFGAGNPQSGLMLIGEAPGADEDRQGQPFVGRSGALLDKMLAAISLPSRDNYYITNVLPWRPPGNRTPNDAEVAACLPFLLQHIALVNPNLIVLLGGLATKTLLQRTEGISRLRGKWYEYTLPNGRVVPVLPMLHPAALLRNPAQKRQAWQDLLSLKAKLQQLASSG